MHSHSRRGFLRQTLGACFTGATILEQAVLTAARARAQSAVALPRLFDIEKAADGVYLAVARPQVMLNCNAVVFENAADLMIVDTHSKPSAVASLVRQLRTELGPKPVRYVVASHFHWDHSQGTPAYRRIAPHADIVATTATRTLMEAETTRRLTASLEQLRKSVASSKESLGKAKTPEEKAYWDRMVRETNDYLAEMKSFAPELPNVTVGEELAIHDKAHDLHLLFRGRGHTAGDVVVWCPQKRVVATGDLLHSFAPYMGDSFPVEWPRTLLAVAQLDFTRVAGGHGAMHENKDRLFQMANYIEEVSEAVARGKRQGRPLEKLQAEITPATLKTLADGGYGRYASENELKYRVFAPGTTVEGNMATFVAANVAQVFDRLGR
jgi:glyoxylase-like metal-dependent hydrolase (beta-lactamase superfamily II)